jgi:hypothetical protein
VRADSCTGRITTKKALALVGAGRPQRQPACPSLWEGCLCQACQLRHVVQRQNMAPVGISLYTTIPASGSDVGSRSLTGMYHGVSELVLNFVLKDKSQDCWTLQWYAHSRSYTGSQLPSMHSLSKEHSRDLSNHEANLLTCITEGCVIPSE